MIFLTVLYLSFFSRPWNTFALPTPLQSIPILNRDESLFGTRSIYGILWSCLSTIFTCTWIVVHPNIPAPGDSQWAVLRRRVAIMAYILIAPEMVITWAGRQHFAARNLAKKHEKDHPGWTRAHAFFLIMGGFTLHEGGKPVRILEVKELEELSEEGKIEWPTITEDEIADRSKGDYLSKIIVLFQTTWFIAQCIARGVYGLDVTELEVVTLAFATLTGVIYFFWWDKPLDVRCSIPVHLLKGRLEEIQNNVKKEDTGYRIIFPDQGKEEDEKGAIIPNPLPSSPAQGSTSTPDPGSISVQGKEGDEKGAIFLDPLLSSPVQGSTSTPDPGLISVQGKELDEKGAIFLNPLPSSPAQGSTSTPDPGSISVQGKEGNEKGAIFPNPLPSFPVQGSTFTPDPGSISVQGKEGLENSVILPNPLSSLQAQGSTSTPVSESISVQGKEGDEKGAIFLNPLPSSPAQGSISTPDPGSISVQRQEGNEKGGAISPNPLPSSPVQGSISTPDPGSVSVQEKEGLENSVILPNPLSSLQAQGSTSTPVSGSISVQGKEGDEKGTILPNPLPSSLAQGSTSTPVPTLTRMQRFQAFRRRARAKHGTVFGLGYVFIVFPLILFFKPFNDMVNAETLEDKTLRVPTFYSPPNNNSGIALVLGICVSIVFGAIHCIAWSFHFATLAEQWAWRISAILVSGLPIVIIAFSGLLTIFDENEHKTTGMELYEAILAFILISMASLYIFARIALLVLPFVALRALAPGAYVQLDWISFLPHI